MKYICVHPHIRDGGMIQYDYSQKNLQGFLAVLEIANNIAKQKDVENCMQNRRKQNLSFLIDHVG